MKINYLEIIKKGKEGKMYKVFKYANIRIFRCRGIRIFAYLET